MLIRELKNQKFSISHVIHLRLPAHAQSFDFQLLVVMSAEHRTQQEENPSILNHYLPLLLEK